MHTYEYARPALTADAAVFRDEDGVRSVLLIRRAHPPYQGMWALPGGFVDENEPLVDAARRELAEETGLRPAGPLAEVGAYGDPGRDPRGWTVTILYAAVLGPDEDARVCGGDDAEKAEWHSCDRLTALAFDHAILVADALAMFRDDTLSPERGPSGRSRV